MDAPQTQTQGTTEADDARVRVRVRDLGDGRVWLEHRSGEAGAFDAAEVELVRHDAALLEEYFWSHF